MKRSFTCALFLCVLSLPSVGKERAFDWVRASEQAVQLAPMGFHQGRTYRPGPAGGNIRVDIQASQPVTVAMVSAEDWAAVTEGRTPDRKLDFRCIREHVLSTTYACLLPGRAMTLVIRNEQRPGGVLLREAALGETESLDSSNELLITYYRWDCVTKCEPKLRWSRLSKQKYEISTVPTVYRIVDPEGNERQIALKVRSAVPLGAALIPVDDVSLIDRSSEALQSLSACRRIGESEEIIKCMVNPAKGPLALVLWSTAEVGTHVKALVQMDAARCVSNCDLTSARW
jgi:hypothetical protein